nr:5009_t:CDS:2 [Entrophospora candida]CAG8553637.1 5667_t:CDS:2 [Entrophospora candida]
MSLVDETSFVSQFLETLSARQVKYPKDFSPPAQTHTPIQVIVKSLKGNLTHTVQIKNSETIYNLKEKLQKITSFTPLNQRLILKGKALIDTKTLFEYGITNDTVIHLVHKPGSTTGGEISKNDSQLSNSGINKIKDSQFWISLQKLLVEQFPETSDADNVLKEFFNCYNNNKDLNININLEDLINKNS